ncbi:MAG: ScyD/ScyE family protein [Anaerolineae bacterium]|jgi:hypothetical protein|nr:ScyD/ScyE family protein [Anaerolineae bacterium]
MQRVQQLFVLIILVILLIVPAFAQESDSASILTGLNNPRHLAFGDDGTLYVVEAGRGGDLDVEGPFGPAKSGDTATIVAIRPDGSAERLVEGLPSLDSLNGEILGAHSVYPAEDGLWVAIGNGASETENINSVLKLNWETWEAEVTIDVGLFEATNNPAGDEIGGAPWIDSNVVDVTASSDGVVYIVDAGGNTVYSWTEETDLVPFASWVDNPVPTSVAVNADGEVLISFLIGYPFPEGGSRVERYSAEGELLETYEGLTAVVDLLVVDNLVYAVEFGVFNPNAGWGETSGRVVQVASDEITVIAEGLSYPYGVAANGDGDLFVTVGASYMTGEGSVLSLSGVSITGDEITPMSLASDAEPMEPAVTPEP